MEVIIYERRVIVSEFTMVGGMIMAFIIGFLCYAKGINDGLDKKDDDIEKIIIKALKRFSEGD